MVGAKVALAGPVEAVAAAEADAAKLPPGVAHGTRYLWLPHPEERKELGQASDYWVNATSVEAEIVRLRRIGFDARPAGADLLAVYLPDYGAEKAKVWEKFGETDPYFHERIAVSAGASYKTFWRQGPTWQAGWYEQKAAQALVFSVPTRTMGQDRLAVLCNSAAPILRADWFLNQIGQQVDRKAGYYDWLGVGKKRSDFEKVVGLDRAAATRVRREVAAIVPESIVALHNRQIFRFGTLTGAYWETRDVKSNDGERNALRLLDGDYKHDAEEIIASLPNGLHAFFLADAAGARADSAPDFIASDGSSSSSDRRVHAGHSCVRCHVEGIRPVNDWARRAYAAPDRLDVLDPARAIRLRQLYASDNLARLIKRDQDDYEEAMRRANGLTVGDNAKVVAAVWSRYLDEPVTVERAAVELGMTPERFLAIVRMIPKGKLDPTLLSLGKREAIPLRREHWEEVYQQTWQLVREAN